jgi:hypothetical protein
MRSCCTSAAVTAPTWRRRIGAAIQWALPAAILALIPKCPACVAAYVLLFTGVGLSMPAAAALRSILIVLCAGALLFLAARAMVRCTTRAVQR